MTLESEESIRLFRWGYSLVMFVGDTDRLLAPSPMAEKAFWVIQGLN